jgi:hypothetical protein
MKKIHAVVLALVALSAFGAISTTSAFAESEWLIDGAVVNTATTASKKGLISWDILILGVLVIAADCEGMFDGTIGPGAADLITEVLNTAGEPTGTPLVGLALSCTVETSSFEECGKVGELAEVWPENLPWETKIELSGTSFLDDSAPITAYEVRCPNGKENLCEGLVQAILTNGVADVNDEFTEGTNEFACSTGVAHLIGTGLIEVTAKTLSVS